MWAVLYSGLDECGCSVAMWVLCGMGYGPGICVPETLCGSYVGVVWPLYRKLYVLEATPLNHGQ